MKHFIKTLPRNFKISVAIIAAVFLIILPNQLEESPAEKVIPQKTDAFLSVSPKLKQKENQYSIKKEINLVSEAHAASDLDLVSAYAAVDFDSGKVLAQKNFSQRISIASITKVMTAVVALDLASPDELFAYTENALSQPATRLAFNPGDKLTLEELLNAILLTSANDCAEAIREGIDEKYGGDVFIRAMNEKAKFLGLKDTHFENPQGFDARQHYSTVHDVAILTHYALTNYPLIAEIVVKEYGELPPTPTHTRYEYLNNWNGLIGVYPGTTGVKIGNTDDAGNTTAVVSEREGKKIIAVVLGTAGVLQRDLRASELLDIGFLELGLSPIEVTEEQLLEKYGTWKYPN